MREKYVTERLLKYSGNSKGAANWRVYVTQDGVAYRKRRVKAEPSSPGTISDPIDMRKAQFTITEMRWYNLGNRSPP